MTKAELNREEVISIIPLQSISRTSGLIYINVFFRSNVEGVHEKLVDPEDGFRAE